MSARRVALALGIAIGAAAVRADAETDRPVFVTVAGHGPIRFRLAAGANAPCDSSDNRMIYDEWLKPGRYVWGAHADVICYQYTSGALRESNWSEPRVLSTVMRHGRPMEIVVFTD